MLIKTIADILNHQSDRFDLLLRPSYSPLFLYNAFRRFPLIPFIYFAHPKKTNTKKSHYKVAKQFKKKKRKGQKYKLFNKKVDFLLVDSIRNHKFAAEIFTHLPQLKEILTISLHLSFTKSYRK